jgi:hypothetical protein
MLAIYNNLLSLIINDYDTPTLSKKEVLDITNTIYKKIQNNISICDFNIDTLKITNSVNDDIDDLLNNINKLDIKDEKEIERIDGINVNDIEVFYEISNRGLNDVTNRLRENILLNLQNITKSSIYLLDETYSTKWKQLKEQWTLTLTKIGIDYKYDDIKVSSMGGRGNHTDYVVSYLKDGEIILKKNVEFKFNASSINKLPQILQVFEGSLKFPKSYAEYYYDNYLDMYLSIDDKLYDIEIPSKEDYMKYVKGTKYECHNLFKKMKDNEETEKDNKFEIVDTSIKEYLKEYSTQCNLEILKEYLNKSQIDKTYVLWDTNTHQFNIDSCSYDPTLELQIVDTTHNSIIIEQGRIIFKLLLRWKNHKGILLPAYQISYKKKDE